MMGNPVRLYRFYNLTVGREGEPFAMCDKCKEKYRVPGGCIMNKIADKATWPCNICRDLEVAE